MPGLGTATGTRVDSAAKHIMACKVDTRLLACWLNNPEADAVNALHSDKMKWCMHKDEIVLNTSKNNLEAYLMVVTTVGEMKGPVKKYLTSLYGKSSASDFYTLQDLHASNDAADIVKLKESAHDTPALAAAVQQQDWPPILQQIKSLPDFRCQGITLGQAWASYLSGDTVASVLVGSMVTVQNGHFTMHTGDLVQWYFDFEQEQYMTTPTETPTGADCLYIPLPAPSRGTRNARGTWTSGSTAPSLRSARAPGTRVQTASCASSRTACTSSTL